MSSSIKDGGSGGKQGQQNVKEENAPGCHDTEGFPWRFDSFRSALAICPWNVSLHVPLDLQSDAIDHEQGASLSLLDILFLLQW